MRGGSNMPRVADYNRVLIVDLVRRHPGISRVELSERTGLTGQTVTNICAHLCDQGLIKESGRVSTGGGRWRTVYNVVAASRYAVGLHVDAVRTALALVDLAGTVIDRTSVDMPASEEPADTMDALAAASREIVARNSVPDKALSGLGVATPGPIRRTAGTVVGPPNLRGWDMVQLREELAYRLGIPVELEKDTVAAATGELWSGNAPSDNFLFVYLGPGVGGGVVLDGEVRHGTSGNLGNFGHFSADPDGPYCQCGGRGCIAVTSTPDRIVDQGVKRGLLEAPPAGDLAAIEVALGELAERAADGHPAAQEIFDRTAQNFGRAIAEMVNVLDLDAVVFGGPNWRHFAEPFLRIVPAVINSLHIFGQVHPVQVGASSLGADVGPIGAASLVLANAVSARPSLLLAAVPSH